MRYCYRHRLEQARNAKRNAERARQRWFESAPLDDVPSIQRALAEVMTRLLSGNIGHKEAGQILYELQMVSVKLRKVELGPAKADGKAGDKSSWKSRAVNPHLLDFFLSAAASLRNDSIVVAAKSLLLLFLGRRFVLVV
jgi:hypothetical protein